MITKAQAKLFCAANDGKLRVIYEKHADFLYVCELPWGELGISRTGPGKNSLFLIQKVPADDLVLDIVFDLNDAIAHTGCSIEPTEDNHFVLQCTLSKEGDLSITDLMSLKRLYSDYAQKFKETLRRDIGDFFVTTFEDYARANYPSSEI